MPGSGILDQRGELLCAHRPALMKTHLFMGFAIGDGPVMHARGVLRLAGVILEGQFHCHEWFFRGLPGLRERIGEREALVRDDFEIDAPIRKLVAIRPAHHDQAGAANAHVRFNDRCRPWPRRKPLFNQLRISPGTEHFFSVRVDDSSENEVAAFGGGIRFIGTHN
jgi:hypothetical protein